MEKLKTNGEEVDWFGLLVTDHARTVRNLNDYAETLAFGRPLTPSEIKMKPNCYDCIHRGDMPGEAHSACRHPLVPGLRVMGDPHGIKNGWFRWPFNFDPVWLKSCNGFTPKNVVNHD